MDALLEVFSPEGRANRAWYFWHIVLDDLAMFTALLVLMVAGMQIGFGWVAAPIVGVIVAGGWAGIAVTVKRLHDLGRPGWHWFLLMVPIYNIYLGLVLLLKKGEETRNRYGPDPLQAAVRARGELPSF